MNRRNTSSVFGLSLGVVALAAGVAFAIDWPGYRGPAGDGITTDKIQTQWPAGGPKVVWNVPLGDSFGSFAVASGKVFIFEKTDDDKEACAALDPNTGKQLWSTSLDKALHDTQGGDGPRSTPTIDGDKVYVMGTFLKLYCLSADDGKVVWTHDLTAEFGGKPLHWGSASSPLIEDDLVIVDGGGRGSAIVAFNKLTGDLAWKALDDKYTHATATSATIEGVHQDIFFMQSGLVSIEPKTGQVLWRQRFPFSTITAASCVVNGNIVYCSAAYGVGAGAFRITKNGDKFTSSQLWRTPGAEMNIWSTPVIKDGYVYGLFGFKQLGSAPLKCIELATGKEVWSKPGFGQGGLILVGNNLLVQGDAGQLVLVEASPAGYHGIAMTHPLAGKCWTMPVVADGRIYARSTKQGVCLDVSVK